MESGKLTLIVRANTEGQALEYAVKRGFTVAQVQALGMPGRFAVDARGPLDKAIHWFCEVPEQPPFPEGTLLYHSSLF